MKKVKYHVPPKLQNKLLLSGLTIPEVGIAFVLALVGFFSTNRLNGPFLAGHVAFVHSAAFFKKKFVPDFEADAVLSLHLPAAIC